LSTTAEQVKHVYQPIGSARKLFSAKDPEVLLSGPAGTGKSRACLEKLHAMALMNPGMRGVILRKTATSLTSTALVTFREHVAKEAIDSGEVRFFGGSSQEASLFKYANGSTITVGGMDKATRIMSSEYDIAYVQEAIELTENDWEAITTRLRHGRVSFQQVIADTNPDTPYHWLKQRCDNGKTRIISCTHEDNPTLYDQEKQDWTPSGASYIAKLDNLTGIRLDRLRYGRWSAADGLIYDTFDGQVHLHAPYRIFPPKDWERYWSIDFGYTNPFVCQFWAKDPDGRLYLYREIYRTQTLVEDHAEMIRKLTRIEGHYDPPPVAVVCDHDAEGRATLEEKLGISTVAAHKSVLEGIEAVKARLKVQDDGKPRLFIARDAVAERDPQLVEDKKPTCTQEELLSYIWTKTVSHDAMKIPKETPRKVDDHGMDAMRYLVAHVDLIGRARIRTLTWLSQEHHEVMRVASACNNPQRPLADHGLKGRCCLDPGGHQVGGGERHHVHLLAVEHRGCLGGGVQRRGDRGDLGRSGCPGDLLSIGSCLRSCWRRCRRSGSSNGRSSRSRGSRDGESCTGPGAEDDQGCPGDGC